jgi:putative phosphonate metabolism protein
MASGATLADGPVPLEGWNRYAIYWRPAPDSALGSFGAGWLGWEPARGRTRPHPEIAGLPLPVAALTETPRRYGVHATLKAPFRLAAGVDAASLAEALRALAGRIDPAECDGLVPARLGDFLALVPDGDPEGIDALAEEVVTGLDKFRAPLSPAEIARRNPARLTAPQRALLERWGYPYVLSEFRFHVSLTGALPEDVAIAAHERLARVLGPILPRPFRIEELTLCGEDAQGRFHDLMRFPLPRR